MGKQSSGKSYLLNHLSGSLFDIAGGRCAHSGCLDPHRASSLSHLPLGDDFMYLPKIDTATRAHVAGYCFHVSPRHPPSPPPLERCTDGVWLSLCPTAACLYLVLDFEGLGSFERSEQEDMLLSIFQAAISSLTIFNKKDFHIDRDTEQIFSRFQSGAFGVYDVCVCI